MLEEFWSHIREAGDLGVLQESHQLSSTTLKVPLGVA